VRGYSEHDINLSSTNEGRNDIMIHQGEMEAELGELHFYGFCNDQSCLTLRELTPDEYGLFRSELRAKMSRYSLRTLDLVAKVNVTCHF
jgi:hypothetical protein